jgi:protein kinase A
MLGGSEIKKMAAGLLHHHHGPGQQQNQPQQQQPQQQHRSSSTSTSPSPASSFARSDTALQERQFVAKFSDQQKVLPPDQIQQDPRNKELGCSSKSLTVRDFVLVRTLGTGAFLFLPSSSPQNHGPFLSCRSDPGFANAPC